MKDESRIWLEYSNENVKSAKILFENGLLNPCLQNVQQSVEKALKALLLEYSLYFRKTHSITEINRLLSEKDIATGLSDDECDFLDSIYLPSKYPVSSVLPHYEPNAEICETGISIARKVYTAAARFIMTK